MSSFYNDHTCDLDTMLDTIFPTNETENLFSNTSSNPFPIDLSGETPFDPITFESHLLHLIRQSRLHTIRDVLNTITKVHPHLPFPLNRSGYVLFVTASSDESDSSNDSHGSDDDHDIDDDNGSDNDDGNHYPHSNNGSDRNRRSLSLFAAALAHDEAIFLYLIDATQQHYGSVHSSLLYDLAEANHYEFLYHFIFSSSDTRQNDHVIYTSTSNNRHDNTKHDTSIDYRSESARRRVLNNIKIFYTFIPLSKLPLAQTDTIPFHSILDVKKVEQEPRLLSQPTIKGFSSNEHRMRDRKYTQLFQPIPSSSSHTDTLDLPLAPAHPYNHTTIIKILIMQYQSVSRDDPQHKQLKNLILHYAYPQRYLTRTPQALSNLDTFSNIPCKFLPLTASVLVDISFLQEILALSPSFLQRIPPLLPNVKEYFDQMTFLDWYIFFIFTQSLDLIGSWLYLINLFYPNQTFVTTPQDLKGTEDSGDNDDKCCHDGLFPFNHSIYLSTNGTVTQTLEFKLLSTLIALYLSNVSSQLPQNATHRFDGCKQTELSIFTASLFLPLQEFPAMSFVPILESSHFAPFLPLPLQIAVMSLLHPHVCNSSQNLPFSPEYPKISQDVSFKNVHSIITQLLLTFSYQNHINTSYWSNSRSDAMTSVLSPKLEPLKGPSMYHPFGRTLFESGKGKHDEYLWLMSQLFILPTLLILRHMPPILYQSLDNMLIPFFVPILEIHLLCKKHILPTQYQSSTHPLSYLYHITNAILYRVAFISIDRPWVETVFAQSLQILPYYFYYDYDPHIPPFTPYTDIPNDRPITNPHVLMAMPFLGLAPEHTRDAVHKYHSVTTFLNESLSVILFNQYHYMGPPRNHPNLPLINTMISEIKSDIYFTPDFLTKSTLPYFPLSLLIRTLYITAMSHRPQSCTSQTTLTPLRKRAQLPQQYAHYFPFLHGPSVRMLNDFVNLFFQTDDEKCDLNIKKKSRNQITEYDSSSYDDCNYDDYNYDDDGYNDYGDCGDDGDDGDYDFDSFSHNRMSQFFYTQPTNNQKKTHITSKKISNIISSNDSNDSIRDQLLTQYHHITTVLECTDFDLNIGDNDPRSDHNLSTLSHSFSKSPPFLPTYNFSSPFRPPPPQTIILPNKASHHQILQSKQPILPFSQLTSSTFLFPPLITTRTNTGWPARTTMDFFTTLSLNDGDSKFPFPNINWTFILLKFQQMTLIQLINLMVSMSVCMTNSFTVMFYLLIVHYVQYVYSNVKGGDAVIQTVYDIMKKLVFDKTFQSNMNNKNTEGIFNPFPHQRLYPQINFASCLSSLSHNNRFINIDDFLNTRMQYQLQDFPIKSFKNMTTQSQVNIDTAEQLYHYYCFREPTVSHHFRAVNTMFAYLPPNILLATLLSTLNLVLNTPKSDENH